MQSLTDEAVYASTVGAARRKYRGALHMRHLLWKTTGTRTRAWVTRRSICNVSAARGVDPPRPTARTASLQRSRYFLSALKPSREAKALAESINRACVATAPRYRFAGQPSSLSRVVLSGGASSQRYG